MGPDARPRRQAQTPGPDAGPRCRAQMPGPDAGPSPDVGPSPDIGPDAEATPIPKMVPMSPAPMEAPMPPSPAQPTPTCPTRPRPMAEIPGATTWLRMRTGSLAAGERLSSQQRHRLRCRQQTLAFVPSPAGMAKQPGEPAHPKDKAEARRQPAPIRRERATSAPKSPSCAVSSKLKSG